MSTIRRWRLGEAKGIGIYGGINDVVANNLLCDTARYLGLGVGEIWRERLGSCYRRQSPATQSCVAAATATINSSKAMMIGNGGDGQGVGTVANAYCANNTIINSLYSAVGISTSTNIVFQYNAIINPGMDGIVVGPAFAGSGVLGNAIINSNIMTGLNPGMVELTNSTIAYAAIIPIAAADYDSEAGVATETCAEGGQDITGIESGDWSAYNNVNLTGVNAFVARVAGAGSGGNIEIHLDSPSGTLAGTCVVPGTGGWQTYVNAYCNVSGASGAHNIYLVYSGGGGNLFNVQFFGFYSSPPELSHQLVPGNIYSLKAVVNGEYVTAPDNGTDSLIAASTSVGTAEQFKIIDAGGGNIAFEAMVNSNIVTAENAGSSPLIANRTAVGSWETFTEVDAGSGNIGLLAMADGKFVTTPNEGASPLIAQSTSVGTAESFAVGLVAGAAPATPANLIGIPGNAQATLTWVASPGATGYNVLRSTTSGTAYAIIATNINGLSYTDTGLANATTYYYVVSAQNAVGNSANSAQTSVVPGSLNRLLWVASSSTSGGDSPGNALDGNLATRWSTDTSQVSGQWFQVDMGTANVFSKLILNSVNSANDYPRGYQVTVSSDGVTWSTPVATGTGTPSITTITFPVQAARYIRITQTGSVSGTFWSIDEFNAMGAAPLGPSRFDGHKRVQFPDQSGLERVCRCFRL